MKLDRQLELLLKEVSDTDERNEFRKTFKNYVYEIQNLELIKEDYERRRDSKSNPTNKYIHQIEVCEKQIENYREYLKDSQRDLIRYVREQMDTWEDVLFPPLEIVLPPSKKEITNV